MTREEYEEISNAFQQNYQDYSYMMRRETPEPWRVKAAEHELEGLALAMKQYEDEHPEEFRSLSVEYYLTDEGKGSHPGQERRSSFASEASLHRINHPGEHVPLLPPAGFHHCQQPLDKSAPFCRLR